MAVNTDNMASEFQFTKSEISKIQTALKDETFVTLLTEYAKELSDPETKKRYEAEICQLENERGYHVSFVHPKPGYVVKVTEIESKKKIFINICSEDQVDKPVSQTGSQGGLTGLQWSIPYSLSKPREDIDKSGECCSVYDVIFHPDTLYLATRDARMKELLHSTAFDALENCFSVKVDRGQVRFPKMKFKGIFRPTIIRRPIDSKSQSSSNENNISILPNTNHLSCPPDLSCTVTPKFSIRYRTSTDLQDHAMYPVQIVSQTRPKEMIVEIELPTLDSSAGIDLDVQEKSLTLSRDVEPRHKLKMDLPFPVDEENGCAKFDKSRHMLIVTLPIKPSPVLIAERLSSNDSGIEVEEGERRRSSVESMDSDEASSDKIEFPIEHSNLINDYRTNGTDVFLKDSINYLLPNYTCSVLSDVIIFTLEVKNVTQSSIEFRVIPGKPAVQVQFCSLGTGQFPIYYAFCFEFLGAVTVSEGEIEVECWDNNIVVQLPLSTEMTKYKIGLSPINLKEKEISVERTDLSEINLKDEDIEDRKKNKYKQEKHPKMMNQTDSAEGKGVDILTKERYSSGESLDSSMSVSPYDRINLEEIGRKDVESDQDENIPRFQRARSMEEPTLRIRGILKRRNEVQLTGTRFRCYSESNVDDIGGWGSSQRLGSALSDTKIEEEEEYEHQTKKTVRFSEKVHQQLYRINSSIVAKTAKNKKKAEKKRRAVERRLSEGDSVELKKTESIKKSASLDSETWNMDSHEDSGLASSFEESVVIGQEQTKVKSKKKTKRRTKTFEMSNDLIFDLDI